VLTAVASPGWTVKGDTVIAPNSEGFGTVRIVATRRAPSPTAGLLAASAAPVDSAISDSVTLAATVNLDTLHLVGTPLMCRVLPKLPAARIAGAGLGAARPVRKGLVPTYSMTGLPVCDRGGDSRMWSADSITLSPK